MSAETLHPCALCARHQKTCCQKTEILVTEADIERIGAVVGHDDFHEQRIPQDQSYLEEDADDPMWLRWTTGADGRRRLLKKQANEDCYFLGEAGCVLTEEQRPLVCRLYPFSYNHREINGTDSEYCPTELLRPYGRDMVEILKMDADLAERWRRQLYDELERGTRP